MADLIAPPHKEGVELLKKELYSEIKRFSLISDNGEDYFSSEINAIYFDSDGVLTVSALIPSEEHFTAWNDAIRVLTADGKIVVEFKTQPIQFVKGVGGEQTLKITVSGKAGEIVFKQTDYITKGELDGLYVGAVQALSMRLMQLENKLIEKGVLSV